VEKLVTPRACPTDLPTRSDPRPNARIGWPRLKENNDVDLTGNPVDGAQDLRMAGAHRGCLRWAKINHARDTALRLERGLKDGRRINISASECLIRLDRKAAALMLVEQRGEDTGP
jgi:hypothetical protein